MGFLDKKLALSAFSKLVVVQKMEIRKKGFVLFILLMFCWPLSVFARTTHITDLRMTHHQAKWRLVFDATGPLRYHQFQLKQPHRIIFDIKQTRLSHTLNLHALRQSPVAHIRASVKSNGDLRLVLDVKRLLRVNSFTLHPSHSRGYRLVVDIINKTARPTPVLSLLRKPKRPPRDVIIVIDPGHGGKDPGAIGRGRTREKRIVLAISKQLQRIINQQPGFKAVLTRKGDYYISLRRRLAIARKYHGDMFIAIHADAYRNRQAHGASVYALSRRGATSEAARWLAKRENESELMGGVDLSDKGHLLKSVLISLSQTATIRASLLIGRDLIHSLDRIASLHHNRVEQAAFVVLKSPDIPSLLVETGFLSNPLEERHLRRSEYRHRLALALMRGIRRYFQQRPPRGTWLAAWRHQKRNQNNIARRHYVSKFPSTSGRG